MQIADIRLRINVDASLTQLQVFHPSIAYLLLHLIFLLPISTISLSILILILLCHLLFPLLPLLPSLPLPAVGLMLCPVLILALLTTVARLQFLQISGNSD